ncbi:MAG: oxygen-dependent coproporphyrinogen oxidase [Pseudomonadota bacterium]|nr:oxygen-dependent coproporphyrinogen oxidase [Pseudomonadota bacterium]
MLNQINQIQTIFENIQTAWAEAFSDAQWRFEQFAPKPNYHNQIMTLEQDTVFEKAGIACSTIEGHTLPPAATKRHPELAGKPFQVTGISLVFHPNNPFVPSVHANLRFFQSGSVWWFGGGMDLTPFYPNETDCKHWHQTIKEACDTLNDTYYNTFKEQCDDYFYLKHRQEMRGIGGIFFDDLNTPSFEKLKVWVNTLGETLINAYQPILARNKTMTFTTKHRAFQQHRRTRYAEFNLLYDRGTIFGLQYGGRIESILMSMPPSTGWAYHINETFVEDEKALAPFLQPKVWASKQTTD